MNFEIVNDGKKVVCNIIDTFNHNGINYIIYTDGTKDDMGELEIYASRYVIKDSNYILEDIINDEEWDLVDEYLDSIYKKVNK